MASALPVKAATTRKADENKRTITLIGSVSHQILGAKLPSNRQVLKVLFFNLRFAIPGGGVRESARITIDAVLIFWQQARIPTRRTDKCIDKLIAVYGEWRALTKEKEERMSANLKTKRASFIDQLDDLFDIATADALATIKNEEDKEFLKAQRQKGRVGSMLGVDVKLANREARSEVRKEKEEIRKRRAREMEERERESMHGDVPIGDVDQSEADTSSDSDSSEDEDPLPTKRRRKTKKKWITPRLCSALDKAKVKRM